MTCESIDILCKVFGQLDINTSGLNALFWIIVLFILVFLRFQAWPFYINHIYPDRVKLEEDKNKNIRLLEENLVKLTLIVEKIDSRGSGYSEKFDEIILKINWIEDQWNHFNQDRKSEAYYHRFDPDYFKGLEEHTTLTPGLNRSSILGKSKDQG